MCVGHLSGQELVQLPPPEGVPCVEQDRDCYAAHPLGASLQHTGRLCPKATSLLVSKSFGLNQQLGEATGQRSPRALGPATPVGTELLLGEQTFQTKEDTAHFSETPNVLADANQPVCSQAHPPAARTAALGVHSPKLKLREPPDERPELLALFGWQRGAVI